MWCIFNVHLRFNYKFFKILDLCKSMLGNLLKEIVPTHSVAGEGKIIPLFFSLHAMEASAFPSVPSTLVCPENDNFSHH